ncbi:MAG: M20/M25/M40 family metallo-hydrolase [Aeoliella sp.]
MPKRRSKKSNRQTPLELVTELMAIPGVSCQEGAVMERVRAGLLQAGAEAKMLRFDTAHKKTLVAGQVGNLILKLPGTVRGPRRMLSAHTDTVPVCLGSKPVRRGKVVESANPQSGLGADDRSGTAVLLATAQMLLRDNPPHYPVTFLWTVQEEVGLHGARHVSAAQLGRPKQAFNFDGGSARTLIIGATGGYRLKIDVRGVASHAGMAPEKGVSAIAIASLAISDLVDNGWHGLVKKGKQTGTSNVGVIEGGAATNVVNDRVSIRAEARSHQPKFRERIVREIEKAFLRAVAKVRSADGKRGSAEFDGALDYEAFRLPKGDPSVQAAAAAIRAEGFEPEFSIASGGLDANWLTARGVPTVTLGCGQYNIHTVDEYLDIAQFEMSCRLAERLVIANEAE